MLREIEMIVSIINRSIDQQGKISGQYCESLGLGLITMSERLRLRLPKSNAVPADGYKGDKCPR